MPASTRKYPENQVSREALGLHPGTCAGGAGFAWPVHMHFGATVREILTASCGRDLRDASASTSLPALDAPATLKTLAANLELAFGIELPERDLTRLHTVRDVLQCVRLRRWEERIRTAEAPQPHASLGAPRPVFMTPTRDPRERFIRFTRRPAPAPPPAPFATQPPSKRV